MSYQSLDIARKLISLAGEQLRFGGEKLTNMKLQKLMYYVQGYHLAAFDEPLFDERIESWMYGPVVPGVYDYYSKYEAEPLPIEPVSQRLDTISERLFRMVFDFLKGFSAIGLMNRTHSEAPWQNALPHKRGVEISNDSIKTYFEGQLPELLKIQTERNLQTIANLPEDWDVYGSPKPSNVSVERMRGLLGKICTRNLIYSVLSPNEWGSVDVNFDFPNGVQVGVSTGDDSFTWYIHKDKNSFPDGASCVPYTEIETFVNLLESVY